MRHWILLSIGFLFLSPGFAWAVTDLGVCSPNGVTVSSDVTVRFNGVGATAADVRSASDSELASPTGGPFAATADANAVLFPPGGGGPKDQVDGSMRSSFEFGTPLGSTPRTPCCSRRSESRVR